MKIKNSFYCAIVWLFFTSQAFCQINPDSCGIQAVESFNTHFLNHYYFVPDTLQYDYTNSERDDTANYTKLYKKAGDNRLLYFTHGYGGKPYAWDHSSAALSYVYKYVPKRPDYSGAGEQDDFTSASRKVATELDDKEYQFRVTEGFEHWDLPYYIGHSLGGIVGRDIDKKYDVPFSTSDPGTDPLIYGRTRRFYGLATFGSPHAGSPASVNQPLMNKLGTDICNSIKDVFITNAIADLTFKNSLTSFIAPTILDKASLFGTRFCDVLGNDILEVATKKNRAPIGAMFAPGHSYLSNLNTYINPNLPKVAFYGVEKEPVFWRIAQFMIHPSEEFAAFQANEDDKIVEGVNEMINDFFMKSLSRQSQVEKNNSTNRKLGFLLGNPLTRAAAFIKIIQLQKQNDVLKKAISALLNAKKVLEDANKQYETIIGANDHTNPASWASFTTKYACRRAWFFGDGTFAVQKTDAVANPLDCSCGTGTNPYPLVKLVCGVATLQTYTETTFKTIPNDGAVIEPSAKAFPGCLDRYKWPMPDSNHLQMRNDDEADRCLRILFDANIITDKAPEFFNVEKR